MPEYRVHMLTEAELDEEHDAEEIEGRLEEGLSTSLGDEFVEVEAADPGDAKRKAEALPEFADRDDWYADQVWELGEHGGLTMAD